MNNISIGDKFKRNGNEYILCRPGGVYYLINLNDGSCWDDGMQYEQLILELINYNFEKIK